jgi:hypothetical protein
MKNAKHFLLFLLILTACKTPSEYFGRVNIIPTINNVGTGFRNGVEIDTTNFICVDPSEYEILQEYFEDKEFRLFRCLKYGRCK